MKRKGSRTEMRKLRDVKERARWAIVQIIERNHLSNSSFSKIMGCSKSTIDHYRRRITTPDTEFIHALVEMYGLDVVWLHHGEGEPFLGDALGPGGPPSLELLDSRETDFRRRRSRKLSRLITSVARIAESKTIHADMLYYGVEHLENDLKEYYRIQELELENKRLREAAGMSSKQVASKPGLKKRPGKYKK